MRRITVLLIVMSFLTACTVQEKMSSEIFVERLQIKDENFLAESFFIEEGNYICFGKYDILPITVKISADKEKNAKKVMISCVNTNKSEEFISCAKSVISVYSPNDNSSDVINNLFVSKSLNGKCTYYETQWYIYSAFFSKHGLYFSVESKKLSPQSEVELSLKQNDIT